MTCSQTRRLSACAPILPLHVRTAKEVLPTLSEVALA